MKKLTYEQKKILAVICSTHPYASHEVEMVYRRCESFYRTIEILEKATTYAVSTNYVLNGRLVIITNDKN